MSSERFFWAHAAGVAGVAALATIPFLSGCPGELANIEDFEEAATAGSGSGSGGLVDPCNALLTQSCALANCHDAESSSVDLTLAGREERLIDQPSPACGGLYIDTANPEASLLYTKCAESSPACGSPMPLGRQPLSQDELGCLLGYIQSLSAGGSTGSSTGSGASSSSASSAAASSGGAD